MEEKDAIIISPRVVLEVLRRNLIFILITVLVFSLGSYMFTEFFITKQYTANVSLYVETESRQDDAYNSLNQHNYATKIVATYIRMLDTHNFYSKLSEYLHEKYTPAQLHSMISFEDDGETEVFDVSVVTPSPSESKVIADAVAEKAPEIISSLKSNATLKIADYAQLPTKHSSPSRGRNIIIAAIIALVLSITISFVRHFADKKIKFSEDITDLYGYPVLAAIPNFDSYINNQKKSKGKERGESNG